jgi:hypothetical protein
MSTIDGAHNDPAGPFGYTPDHTKWDTAAGAALQSAQNFANAAARSVADWVVARLPLDAFRINHYRRAVAAERYAHAVYEEAMGLPQRGTR